VSVPVNHMYDIVDKTRARVEDNAIVGGYGHIGDGFEKFKK
jgi:hypothetical protein